MREKLPSIPLEGRHPSDCCVSSADGCAVGRGCGKLKLRVLVRAPAPGSSVSGGFVIFATGLGGPVAELLICFSLKRLLA